MNYDWRLEIGFYAGGSVSFSGATPQQRDLGGAEYCCVSMAESLAARGHRVSVFVPDSKEVFNGENHLEVNGVIYYPRERVWKEVCHATQWDVFIISREYPVLSNTVLNSKLTVLWNHDILSDPEQFREHIHRADKIFCLSTYHKQQYLKQLTDEHTGKCTLKPEHITITRNGVDTKLIQEALKLNKSKLHIKNGKFTQPTFVYSSRPERGLKYLLRDIWPQIVAELPDARLKVACYNLDTELLPDNIAKIHQECYQLIRSMPSVEFIGSLRRLELFQVIAASHAMIYPSIFPEISCLSILEAQCLGTPALTSERGALNESNWSDEHIIFDWQDVEDGKSATEYHRAGMMKWIRDFIENYNKPGEVEDRALIQHDMLEFFDWHRIAGEWEEQFYMHFQERAAAKPKRIIQNLIYNSDLLAALWACYNTPDVSTSAETCDELSLLANEIEDHLKYHHEEPEQYADKCGDTHEDIYICPDRMKISLDIIEKKYGRETPFTFLDIGCGAGRMLYHVLKYFPQAQIQGFDFSEQLCEQAKRNILASFQGLANDEFIRQCDVLEMPPPQEEDKADVVFVGEWLEHQVDLVQALQTVDSWCKEGGLVIYTTPYGPWEAITFGEATTKDGHEIRFHVSHFEHRDLQEMFRDVDPSIEASYIQHSPLDLSVIGNFVTSYEKRTISETDELYPPRFYAPDYHRKFLTTRPYIRIGALMITKDEEDNITRALKPLKRRVDRICVYDTGSTDRTVMLAEDHAEMVVKGYWNDDFAAARNRALDIIRHFPEFDVDWVYWQDADEALLNGYKLKFYVQGDLEIYQGFIIQQCHLMIDYPQERDIPIRLFRNKPQYKFIGKIHEHVLDSTDPTGNTNLFPLYIMPDVKIAHYGYITEDERRWKAIHRNWDILKEDLKENPQREMTHLFLMRDYLHHVRWHLEKRLPLTQEDIALLYEVIEKYQPFKHPKAQNHFLARAYYQNALQILGEHNYPTKDGRVPVQLAITLAAKRGKLRDEQFQAEKRWFINGAEMEEFILHNEKELQKFVDKKPHTFED